MKKIICCCILLIGAIKSVSAQKIIFSDNFNDNQNKWTTYIGDSTSYLVYNGKYVMDNVYDSLTYNVFTPVKLDTAKNYSITLTATHTTGRNDYGYGLYFGGSDVNNYYGFNLASGGYFKLYKTTTAGGYVDLVKWTASPIIKTGNYVDNKIQIIREGSNWKLMINDQLITTVSAMPLLGNLVGFSKENKQRVEFDNLTVTQ